MDKYDFLDALREKLSGLPKEDVWRSVEFYSEMIDDRIEEGMTEAEAVADIGDVSEISQEIIRTTPLAKIVKEKVKPKRRLRWWEIVLLAVGSPLWISLLAALFCIILAVYIVIWVVVLTFICVDIAFFATALALFTAAAGLFFEGFGAEAVLCMGTGLVMGGLSLLTFLFVKVLTKGAVWLSKKIVLGIKACFVGKGGAK
ncbi:MAG: DUF1700 domain-containing protein [Ruminococcus sp.]|nr:DUF1700 domain-containing protein [Ruminococcus sp.]